MSFNKSLTGLALLVIVFSLASCQSAPPDFQQANPAPLIYTQIQHLTTFTENSVKVEIVLERNAAGNLILAGTYTPTQPQFHLYSKDLPREGIEGAGRPSLLELTPENSIRVIGPLFADKPVSNYQIKGFSKPFPIYPDGSVTLRLPIEGVSTNKDPIQMEISVTYMACSSLGRCLPPVMDKRVQIIVTSSLLSQTASR